MVRMQLTLHAEKLKNNGGLVRDRVSDPYAVVSLLPSHSSPIPVGRTETIQNNLSPDWTTIFYVDAEASKLVPLQVEIYDDNENREDMLMATVQFPDLYSVYECVGDSEVLKHMQFAETPGGGRLYVHLERSLQGPSTGSFTLKLRGLDVKNVESGVLGLGRSDPFFEIAKKNADPDNGIVRWNTFYRSKVEIDNLNPFWEEEACMSLEAWCYGVLDWPLKISVFDWEKSGKHRIIGQVETTLGQLQQRVAKKGNGDREQAFVLTKEGKTKKKGLLVVLKADLVLQQGP